MTLLTSRATVPAHTGSSLPDRIAGASRRPAALGGSARDAVSLAMGEPDADTPAPVVQAAVDALRAGRTRYAPLTGAPDLRTRLAEHLSATTGGTVSADDVVLTHGGSAALAATVLALVAPGDRVLVPEPTYSLYADHIAMAGAEIVWVPPTEDGRPDLRAVAELATDATMLIACNPVNPTGQVFTDTELEAVAGVLRDNPGLVLVSDEAYCDIVFDERPFRSALTLGGVQDQVVVVGTFSKSFAMTGWRLGYAVTAGPAAQINLVHRTLNGALNTFVQDAGIAALDATAQELAEQTASYQRRRDLVVDAFRAMPGVTVATPEGAFYAFPRIDTDVPEDELLARFTDAGVLVRGGTEYGPSGAGHIRISFATDEASLTEGLRRFAGVVAEVVR